MLLPLPLPGAYDYSCRMAFTRGRATLVAAPAGQPREILGVVWAERPKPACRTVG